jgi:hypothetical protein
MKMTGGRQMTEWPEDGKRQVTDGNHEDGRRKAEDREA